jgi:hypothetical protein
VFAWDGSAWRVMRSFGQSDYLFSVLPLGPSNVLVFQEDGSTWHYGPSGWSRERTGNGLRSGSELHRTASGQSSRMSEGRTSHTGMGRPGSGRAWRTCCHRARICANTG